MPCFDHLIQVLIQGILAQQSLDFIWDLVQKRAKEIKEQAYAEEE